jgi:hypothetical protein
MTPGTVRPHRYRLHQDKQKNPPHRPEEVQCEAHCFVRGACTAVRKIVVPAAWKTAPEERVKSGPRSRIRNRKSPGGSPRFMARLRACCTPSSHRSGGR